MDSLEKLESSVDKLEELLGRLMLINREIRQLIKE